MFSPQLNYQSITQQLKLMLRGGWGEGERLHPYLKGTLIHWKEYSLPYFKEKYYAHKT